MSILIDKILESPGGTKNPDLIKTAFQFAEKAHEGQRRLSGENYISHPLHVAYFLAGLGLDSTTIAAGLLHDVIEDTKATPTELEKEFGKDVAFMVKGVTKLDQITDAANPGSNFVSLKKMFFATAEDIRVILIKLADRYHNM
ncbi:MAG: HD domain-containing protein, partial [Candidatus Colwellbacteria bacterium]|nr:HD domain-containing protein [Candidatus Colwellbacteria bacterium]